jgi:hypothetical protein
MAAPGWYRDPGSDRLARWFDGDDWTHHTVVMADWRGRGTPPPPEDRTIVQSSHDAYVPPGSADWAAPTGPAGYEDFDPYDTSGSYDDDGDPTLYAAGGPAAYQPTLADRFREAPNWFRLGAPVLLALIMVVALAAIAGGGDDDPGVEVTSGAEVTLDEAVEIAYDAGFPREVSEARVGGLIKSACAQVGNEDGATRVADQLERFGFDGADLSGATRGLRAGGEAYCADALEEENDPNFFRDVALAISGDSPAATTTTTVATTTSAEVTSTTRRSTTTTKKPTTATTKKPTPTTTVPDSVPDEPDPDPTTTTEGTSTTAPTTTTSTEP